MQTFRRSAIFAVDNAVLYDIDRVLVISTKCENLPVFSVFFEKRMGDRKNKNEKYFLGMRKMFFSFISINLISDIFIRF